MGSKKIKELEYLPELLAPVGGYGQLVAAVENGADAVYMSGKLFNARMNADNFQDDELIKAIEYAHGREVDIHITINTLIRQDELEAAVSYACQLYTMGVDALIVQDMGLASILKKVIPDMPLHLSTQGTVYNQEGVEFAVDSGFSRIILARELSLPEIRSAVDTARKRNVEIETFVHGALCICYSGQCHLSSQIGGRSGNRGVCAQPCRLSYNLLRDNQPVNQAFDYPLSPKDFCTIQSLDKLIEAGVNSFKIEGRMKSKEYVAVAVKTYRKYLDEYGRKKPEKISVSQQDMNSLLQIYSRGEFTDGYLHGETGSSIMSGNLSKHQGLYLGKVKSWDKKKKYVTIKLERSLSQGDGIEIQCPDLPGNVVTYIAKDDRSGGKAIQVKNGEAGDTVTIGDIPGTIKIGAPVYKMTDKQLIRDAEEWSKINSRKTPVDIHFYADIDKAAVLKITDEYGNKAEALSESFVEKAIHKSLDSDTIKGQLGKTGGTPFITRNFNIEFPSDGVLPVKEINAMRRSGLSQLERTRINRRIPSDLKIAEIEGHLQQFRERLNKTRKKSKAFISRDKPYVDRVPNNVSQNDSRPYNLYYYQGKIFETHVKYGLCKGIHSVGKIYLPYTYVLNHIDRISQELFPVIVPTLPTVTKGWHDENIKKVTAQLKGLYEEGKIKGILCGNPGHILVFKGENIPLYGDYSMNVYNLETLVQMEKAGLQACMLSQEFREEELDELMARWVAVSTDENAVRIQPECTVYGHVPVMVSAHCAIGGSSQNPMDSCSHAEKKYFCKKGKHLLEDRKGVSYPILSDSADCTMVLLSGKPVENRIYQNAIQRRIYINQESVSEVIRLVQQF